MFNLIPCLDGTPWKVADVLTDSTGDIVVTFTQGPGGPTAALLKRRAYSYVELYHDYEVGDENDRTADDSAYPYEENYFDTVLKFLGD